MSHAAKTTTISSTEAQTSFGNVLRRVNKDKEHLVVERAGIPVAVILSFSEYEAMKWYHAGPTDMTRKQ